VNVVLNCVYLNKFKHGNKTPFEVLIGRKPELDGLHLLQWIVRFISLLRIQDVTDLNFRFTPGHRGFYLCPAPHTEGTMLRNSQCGKCTHSRCTKDLLSTLNSTDQSSGDNLDNVNSTDNKPFGYPLPVKEYLSGGVSVSGASGGLFGPSVPNSSVGVSKVSQGQSSDPSPHRLKKLLLQLDLCRMLVMPILLNSPIHPSRTRS
jgi:hypothetical protein